MNCLVVVAHPLEDSLCHFLADHTIAHLKAKGYDVSVKNLYAEAFDPLLSADERASYYTHNYNSAAAAQDIAELEAAESLVLVFPTWWFGFPAILKGWFDRVWAPGHAYLHAEDFGSINPNLHNLKEFKAVTTLGSPWWVDFFILRRPIRRVLKLAILGTCTKNCDFKFLSLYKTESLTTASVEKFLKKIQSSF